MGGQREYLAQTLRMCARPALVAFLILGFAVPFTSCADLREEFDASQWQYRPVPQMPPSWENDYGRPPMGAEGEEPF
jgi:hypothetical protein